MKSLYSTWWKEKYILPILSSAADFPARTVIIIYLNSCLTWKSIFFPGGSLHTTLTLAMKTKDVEIKLFLAEEPSIGDRDPGEATKWFKRLWEFPRMMYAIVGFQSCVVTHITSCYLTHDLTSFILIYIYKSK